MTEGKDDKGRYIAGNQFWKARSRHGPAPTFTTADQLREACEDYFDWVEGNPLNEAKAFAVGGAVEVISLPKMRAMTMGGLWMFIDIRRQTWAGWYESRPDLVETMEWAEAVVYRQKFEGAAADLLNASIIARDLGLAEKTGVEHSGSIKAEVTSDAAFAQLASLMGSIVPGAPGSGDGPDGVAEDSKA